MEINKENFLKYLEILNEKAEENIKFCTDKFSFIKYFLNNHNIEYKNKIIETLININYINNCFKQQRFMTIEERINYLNNQTFPNNIKDFLFFSQGLKETITWKGNTIYKSSHDLIIYQMLLWELKPRTIIEIGSGNGSSADYFSNLNLLFNNDCEIFSFDINNQNIKKDKINFLKIDLKNENSFNDYLNILNNLKRPVLCIEDAHINFTFVIPYLSKFLISNDYFVIEDSNTLDENYNKSSIINEICKKQNFVIDTRFTDFFGVNITTATNSILKKI